MTPYRYRGLLGDAKAPPLWPLLIVSASLHVLLFWGFSSLHFGESKRGLFPPVTMVELAGPPSGGATQGQPNAPPPPPREARAPAPPEPPPSKSVKQAKAQKHAPEAKPVRIPPPPRPEAPQARPQPKPEPAAKPKTPPKAEAIKLPAKALPAPPTRPAASPAPPPQQRETESPEEHVADRIAKLREKRGTSPEDLVADRIAKIREKRSDSAGEADVADRIAKIRERQIQGSESQVARRIEALREKYGTREPGKGAGRQDSPAGSLPLSVQGSGAGGAVGLIEANYLRNVKDHIDLHWSVPETLKGKGFRATVTVFVNRTGVITDWALQGSGNPFFDERVKRAVIEANPLPPAPAALPGQRFEYELRFSAP